MQRCQCAAIEGRLTPRSVSGMSSEASDLNPFPRMPYEVVDAASAGDRRSGPDKET
jgi:hypothetical protein